MQTSIILDQISEGREWNSLRGAPPVEESQASDSIMRLSNSVNNRFSSKMRISHNYLQIIFSKNRTQINMKLTFDDPLTLRNRNWGTVEGGLAWYCSNGEWKTQLCAVIIWGDNLTGEEKHFSSWIYTEKNNTMLFLALSYVWHVILFLCLMFKSFHISSKIDPVYPIITL